MSLDLIATWQPSEQQTDFDRALAAYGIARKASDDIPVDDVAGDAGVDLYCMAMDHVIEDVRAPSLAALGLKLELAHERCGDDSLFDDYWTALKADVQHLQATGVQA